MSAIVPAPIDIAYLLVRRHSHQISIVLTEEDPIALKALNTINISTLTETQQQIAPTNETKNEIK